MNKVRILSLLGIILYNCIFSMEFHPLNLKKDSSDYSYYEPKEQDFYSHSASNHGSEFYIEPLTESKYTSVHQQFINNVPYKDRQTKTKQQHSDPAYYYRSIDLDNKESTQFLKDPEMQRYHTWYLNNQVEGLKSEQQQQEKYFNDDYGGVRKHVDGWLNYNDYNKRQRRLSFIKRLLNHHDQKMAAQVYKAESSSLNPRSQFKSLVSDENNTSSYVPSPIIIDTSLNPVSDQQVYYDYKSTTPQSDLFHQKITVNPNVDFHHYMQQIEHIVDDLKHKGQYSAETAELFIKGFAKGTAEHLFYIGKHPIKYVQNFVHGNLELAKQIVLFFSDIDNTPEHEYISSYDQMKQYEQQLNQKADHIIQMYNKFCETIPQISREDWGRISARLFVDCLLCKGVGKGFNIAKNAIAARVIKQKPLLAKVQHSFEQEVRKNAKEIIQESTGIVRPLDYGRTNIHRKQLKEVLKTEEITSIIDVTEHGLQRLFERDFEIEEILSLINEPDYVKIQNNGLKTFIKQVDKNRYNLMAINPQTKKVVSALRNIDQKAVDNLGTNYGWSIKWK